MKIRSLELRNFRKFVGRVRVDGIGDGLNILVGRNEYGKSTLLEAINGVIFEKATAQSQRTDSFRHFVNGTVPEVALRFDLDGAQWNLHKRFAGQAGKAVLTDQNGHRSEGEAAEAELQGLLGFERRRGNAEPAGIWGTLWVQQGKSFAGTNLDELGRRSLQGCIEAQVGVVTGGERGQKIPTAVKDALDKIQTESRRTPRGKHKEAADRLAQTRGEVAQFEAKRTEIFRHMDELAGLRRERQRALADWNDDAHQRELSDTRDRRGADATKAAEISAARDAAKRAAERAKRAKTVVVEREALIAELVPLEVDIGGLTAKFDEAEKRRAELKSQLDATEGRLVGLRQQQRDNGAKARRLERIRSAQIIANEIERHEETLARAAELRSEIGRLMEAIGANPATDENLSRVEDATTELEGARAAIHSVATTVSFALDRDAARRVRLDGRPLNDPTFSVPVVTKTTIAVDGVGEITIEPQIAAREGMIGRARRAEDDLRAALETAGAADLPAARRRAAQRNELVRDLTGKQQEIGRLAPADKAHRLPAGIEARATRVSELRGRLATETEALALASVPAAAETEEAISAAHREGESISAEIDAADAALEGPKRSLAEAEAAAQDFEKRLIRVRAAFDGKREQLAASRSGGDDGELRGQAEKQVREAADTATVLEELERKRGETVEEIDVRIKRLEEAARQHKADIDRLNNEISRLGGVLEANEGIGVEEALDKARAEEAQLEVQTKHYQEEAAVLELLRDTLREAESEAKQRYVAPVVQRAAPYLRMLLPETDLVFDEDLSIRAIERDGATESFVHLSAGTQEQLAVLTRLAFAELLLDQGRPATVILDDALVFSDDERIERMFDILNRAGEKVQIIVLTCRRRLFARLGAPILQIEECAEAA